MFALESRGVMQVARAIVIVLLILGVLISYHPLVRENIGAAWENIRPTLVTFMDSSYAVIRSFIAGDGSHDHMDVPPSNPGVDFNKIVTMNNIGFS
jgi:hypothetical protein